jgi:hypothetical protein
MIGASSAQPPTRSRDRIEELTRAAISTFSRPYRFSQGRMSSLRTIITFAGCETWLTVAEIVQCRGQPARRWGRLSIGIEYDRFKVGIL